MDLVMALLRAGLTVVFLMVVVAAIAALFMIVFGIATGIDENSQG